MTYLIRYPAVNELGEYISLCLFICDCYTSWHFTRFRQQSTLL